MQKRTNWNSPRSWLRSIWTRQTEPSQKKSSNSVKAWNIPVLLAVVGVPEICYNSPQRAIILLA